MSKTHLSNILNFIFTLWLCSSSYAYTHKPIFLKQRQWSRHFLGSDESAKSSLPDLTQTAFPCEEPTIYDLIVFGSGPAGESVAVQAARLGSN